MGNHQGLRLSAAGRTRRAVAGAMLAGLLVACGGGSDPDTQRTAQAAQANQSRALAASAVASNDITVVELVKVSEARVSRTSFDYTFQVRVRNGGAADFRDVVLTLTAVGSGASIIDASVALGGIAIGAQALSTDTIKIRQDRTQPFDAAALVWRIEGTAVPAGAAQLAALEAAGAIPSLERGNTLLGTDADANGVRDDVDAYIVAQYPEPAQRSAAAQAARALQASLLVPAGDTPAAKEVSRQVAYAARCIFNRFPGPPQSKDPGRVMKEIEGVTANTKQRVLAYLAYNKALDGTSSALPSGDTCD